MSKGHMDWIKAKDLKIKNKKTYMKKNVTHYRKKEKREIKSK